MRTSLDIACVEYPTCQDEVGTTPEEKGVIATGQALVRELRMALHTSALVLWMPSSVRRPELPSSRALPAGIG